MHPTWDERVQGAFVDFCTDALAAALASRRLAPGDTFTVSLEIPPDFKFILPNVLQQVAEAAGVSTGYTQGSRTLTLTKFIRDVPAQPEPVDEPLDRRQLEARLRELEDLIAAQQAQPEAPTPTPVKRKVTVQRVASAVNVVKAGEYLLDKMGDWLT